MAEIPGGLDKKTLERLTREWDRLPRGKGNSGGSVGAFQTEEGEDVIVVQNNTENPDEEIKIITEEGRTSDLN